MSLQTTLHVSVTHAGSFKSIERLERWSRLHGLEMMNFYNGVITVGASLVPGATFNPYCSAGQEAAGVDGNHN